MASMHNCKLLENARQARNEARARLRGQNGLNGVGEGIEFAYSPSTFAVGMRWQFEEGGSGFRVFNIYYPMHGRNDEVMDWVSVGMSTPATYRTLIDLQCEPVEVGE